MSYFFFSSRRRHTRFDCDWSSDVCSSDLCLRLSVRRRSSDRHPPVPKPSEIRQVAGRQAARSCRRQGSTQPRARLAGSPRSEEHTSELQSQSNLVCRLLLEKKKKFYPTLTCCH